MANENETLQNLLMAALHNPRPPVIESDPVPPDPTSAVGQLVKLLTIAANQGVETANAKSIALWEECERRFAAAINEAIEQQGPVDE